MASSVAGPGAGQHPPSRWPGASTGLARIRLRVQPPGAVSKHTGGSKIQFPVLTGRAGPAGWRAGSGDDKLCCAGWLRGVTVPPRGGGGRGGSPQGTLGAVLARPQGPPRSPGPCRFTRPLATGRGRRFPNLWAGGQLAHFRRQSHRGPGAPRLPWLGSPGMTSAPILSEGLRRPGNAGGASGRRPPRELTSAPICSSPPHPTPKSQLAGSPSRGAVRACTCSAGSPPALQPQPPTQRGRWGCTCVHAGACVHVCRKTRRPREG